MKLFLKAIARKICLYTILYNCIIRFFLASCSGSGTTKQPPNSAGTHNGEKLYIIVIFTCVPTHPRYDMGYQTDCTACSCRFLGSSWGYNKLYFHVEFNCLTIFIILIFIFHRVKDMVEKTSFLKRLVHDVGGQKWESSWAETVPET